MTKRVKFPYNRYSEEWERQAGLVARSYAPTIHPCADCGAPTVKGYCCTYCGSANPNRPLTEQEQKELIEENSQNS